jgi:hypothetical protein
LGEDGDDLGVRIGRRLPECASMYGKRHGKPHAALRSAALPSGHSGAVSA